MGKHIEHHERAEQEEHIRVEVAEDDTEACSRCSVGDHVKHRTEIGALLQAAGSKAIGSIERLAQHVAAACDSIVGEGAAVTDEGEYHPNVADEVGYEKRDRHHRGDQSTIDSVDLAADADFFFF